MRPTCPTVLTAAVLVGCCSFHTAAQFMRDNAPDGNSSLIGGTTVSFDVQKTTLQVDYTGKLGRRRAPTGNPYWNWGASLSGGNSNNVAQLLQDGSFTPSARVAGFVFHGWNGHESGVDDVKDAYNEASDDVFLFRAGQQTWFEINLVPDLSVQINRLPPTDRDAAQALYNDRIDKGITLVVIAYRQAQKQAPAARKPIFADIIALITEKMAQFNQQLTQLELKAETARQQYFDFQRQNPVRRFLVYGRAGVEAAGFSYFSRISPADIAGSFRDSLFTSPYIEVGGNLYARGYLIMGLNVGYGRVNTLQNSSPVVYKYRAVINGDGGQQLTSEREIRAYAGVPTQYGQFRVKADLIGLIPAGDRGTLALHPYVRFSTGATTQNRWRYGIAGYYFNRKGGFMGGLYAERTYLVTQTAPNTRTVDAKGISLGLRAAYLLDSVFNVAKPR